MFKIATSWCLGAFMLMISTTATFSDEFVPLKDYSKARKSPDVSEQLYIFDRCIGMFIFAASSSNNMQNDTSQAFTDTVRNLYAQLAALQADLIFKNFKDPNREREFHTNVMKSIVGVYQKRADSLYLKGKSIDDDKLMSGDFEYCVSFYKSKMQ